MSQNKRRKIELKFGHLQFASRRGTVDKLDWLQSVTDAHLHAEDGAAAVALP